MSVATTSLAWGLVRLVFARWLDFHCPAAKLRIGEFLRNAEPVIAAAAAAAPASAARACDVTDGENYHDTSSPQRQHRHVVRLETLAGQVLVRAFDVGSTDKVLHVKQRIARLKTAFPVTTTALLMPASSGASRRQCLRELFEYDHKDTTGALLDMRAVVEAKPEQLFLVTVKAHELKQAWPVAVANVGCPSCHLTGPSAETGHLFCGGCGWCGTCCIQCVVARSAGRPEADMRCASAWCV
jgi:hypothetical protein